MRAHTPGPQRANVQVLLEAIAESLIVVIRPPEGAETCGIATQEIRVLFEYVPETRDIGGGGAAAVGSAVQHPMIFRGYVSPVVMERHVFAQQAIVVTQA